MLISLSIHNYALISSLEIEFGKGFSVITGETGAGKSIILGALSLILGQRADAKSIKQEENKCTIEGVFDISSYHLKDFFENENLEYDEKTCIIRRELFANGKSRSFVNDSPAGLGSLRNLGARLIDVHSQHQNLLLGSSLFQLQVLDAMAGNAALLSDYQKTFHDYKEIFSLLEALKTKMSETSKEEDYLRFQLKQLSEAGLKEGEQADLEKEAETLSHVEEIKTSLFDTVNVLSEEERGVVPLLKSALGSLRSLAGIYPEAEDYLKRMESAYIDLKDLSDEMNSKQENLDLDPSRLQFVNDRLDLIYSLEQKHNLSSVEDLVALKNEIEGKINLIDHSEENIREAEEKCRKIHSELLEKAASLTESRKKASSVLEKELVGKVKMLGMPNIQFQCHLKEGKEPGPQGRDEVEFLFSANKNGRLQAVSEVASGGEISRLMLGIKSLIAGMLALPTIIFDEIDTGVSGEIADKMGRIMLEMGKRMQVLAITHLPQIASKGEAHYFVYKEDTKDSSETRIRKLDEEEREKEIAHMLSGSEITEAALENARNLLNAE